MATQECSIHPQALIEPGVELGVGVEVGPFSVIETGARIGDGCRIASHVLIKSAARLGKECRVFKGAVVGTEPQDLKFGNEVTELIVGDRTTIREFATLNRGTAHGHNRTTVGSDCLLMAYSHVAHDCIVGNSVILANCVTMAGHVTIGDFVNISGMTAIHQFVRIGCYAYIGGLSRINQDVPPYALISGIPPLYYGPNSIGLRRHGFSTDRILMIKRAYGYIYKSGLNLTQAIDAIKSELEPTDEVKVILDFIAKSERGLSSRAATE